MAPTYNCIRAHIVISILPRWDLKTRKNVWRKTKNEITSWFAPKPTLYLGAKTLLSILNILLKNDHLPSLKPTNSLWK